MIQLLPNARDSSSDGARALRAGSSRSSHAMLGAAFIRVALHTKGAHSANPAGRLAFVAMSSHGNVSIVHFLQSLGGAPRYPAIGNPGALNKSDYRCRMKRSDAR